jgi:hypothetical protein
MEVTIMGLTVHLGYMLAFVAVAWTALSSWATLRIARRFFGEPDAMPLEPGHMLYPGEFPERAHRVHFDEYSPAMQRAIRKHGPALTQADFDAEVEAELMVAPPALPKGVAK